MKKLLCVLLVICLAISALPIALFAVESELVAGDLTGDGTVTRDDAIHLLYYSIYPDNYEISQPVDYDADGEITRLDAIYLLYHSLFPSEYPLPELDTAVSKANGSFSCQFSDNDYDSAIKSGTLTGNAEDCWGTQFPDITSAITSITRLRNVKSIKVEVSASNTDACWNGATPRCELHVNSRADGGAEAVASFEDGKATLNYEFTGAEYAIILNPYAFSSSAGTIDFTYTVTVTYKIDDGSSKNDGLAAQLYGTSYEYTESELSAMKTATYSYDTAAPSLYEAFADYFNVGTCINSWNLNSTTSSDFRSFMKQFNTFVYENESKPDAMHPSENTYNFSNMDKLVDFGQKYGVNLRGHTLIWHAQCPDWFFYKSGTSGTKATAAKVLERIDTHVTTIVSRYKGKVRSWDVVNEVLNDDGTLRDSNWLQTVGDYDGDGDKYDFIEQAFRSAAAADPDAKLIINDYNLEWSTAKTQGMYDLVKSMLEDGIKVDGIGLQMHIGYDTNISQLRTNMEKLAGLKKYNPNFTLEVTEMDVSCFKWGDDSKTVDLNATFMAQYNKTYTEAFKLFMDLADRGVVDTVVFWGINDGNSWINSDGRVNHPFLIARENKIKSTYWEVLSLVLD